MENISREELTRRLMEKYRADASRMLVYTSQLKALLKDNETAEANVEKKSRELEVKEKELHSLSLDLEKRCQILEKEKANHDKIVGDIVKKRFQELDLKDKELQSLSLDLEKRCQLFEKEKANHDKIVEDSVKKRSQELDLKEKELQSLSLELEKRCVFFEKEKAEAGDLKKLVEDCSEELKSKKNELTVRLDSLTRTQRETESREKQLAQVTDDFRRRCKDTNMVNERKRELEEEIAKRKTELAQILDQIKASGKQFVMADEQLESKRGQVGIVSSELVSKEKELERVRESIKLSNSDPELKEKQVKLLNNQITVCVQAIDMKTKELGELQRLIEEQTRELGVMHNQSNFLKLTVQELLEKILTQVERHKKISQAIERISSEMEEKTKDIKAAETKARELHARSQLFRQEVKENEKKLDFLKNQIESGERKLVQLQREMEETAEDIEAAESEASDLSSKPERFRQEVKGKEKELHLLKNHRWSEETKLTQLKKEIEKENDRNKKGLALILSQIKESDRQLADVDEKLKSQQKLLDTQSMELVSKDMELESVTESSKRLKVDLEVKERRVQELDNLIRISTEQLELKYKELGEVQKLIEEQTKKLCDIQQQQPPAAPSNDTSQQNAAEAEPVDEDPLMHFESSESLLPDEVSTALRASPDPAGFVLDLVQEQIQERLSSEDSVMEILVLLLDELAKIQRPEKSQLQHRATEVATLWKGKITIEAPKSSLGAFAFLMFIAAYELKELINREEIVLLASAIAQYKQAPILFNSLGLKPEMIPEIVNELIKQSQYIPAVRFICHFKLTNIPPSHLLMEEITNLRRSVLEKRPTGSSQAKDKEAGTLRAILEVVADYELKIDLPGDLVAKLMVQRESSIPLVRCSVTHLTYPDLASAQQSSVNLDHKLSLKTRLSFI